MVLLVGCRVTSLGNNSWFRPELGYQSVMLHWTLGFFAASNILSVGGYICKMHLMVHRFSSKFMRRPVLISLGKTVTWSSKPEAYIPLDSALGG